MMNGEYLFSVAVTLMIILDPFGNAPIVHSLLRGLPPRRRAWVMARETLFFTLVLLLFYALGGSLLRYFGISEAALTLTGGLLLMLIAVGLVFPRINVLEDGSAGAETGRPPAHEPFLVPITVPLVVGPAGMAYVMLQASFSHGLWAHAASVGAIVAACLATGALMGLASGLIARAGHLFAVVLERVMGTLLAMIALEMLLNGVSMYIRSLS